MIFLGYHAVPSTCEDLLIDYYCRTDIDKARVISALQHKSKFNFDLF